MKTMSPSKLIDSRIKELGGCRGKLLTRIRKAILAADSEIIEEWKWSVPVWSHIGIICTGETYKDKVKLTFFNSSLEGNVRRAIDFYENDKLNEKTLKTLIRAAIALNKSK